MNHRPLKDIGIPIENIDQGAKPEGLAWRPIALRGIDDNNGWTRISGPAYLPKTNGKYLVLGKSGKMEEWHYSDTSSVRSVWLEYFTHWRPSVEIPGPVY